MERPVTGHELLDEHLQVTHLFCGSFKHQRMCQYSTLGCSTTFYPLTACHSHRARVDSSSKRWESRKIFAERLRQNWEQYRKDQGLVKHATNRSGRERGPSVLDQACSTKLDSTACFPCPGRSSFISLTTENTLLD